MRKIKCPCCGFYTIDYDESEVIVDICPVCSWQYDIIGHKNPDRAIGPNRVSLNEAIKNYKSFGASEICHKKHVREPLPEEYPDEK